MMLKEFYFFLFGIWKGFVLWSLLPSPGPVILARKSQKEIQVTPIVSKYIPIEKKRFSLLLNRKLNAG